MGSRPNSSGVPITSTPAPDAALRNVPTSSSDATATRACAVRSMPRSRSSYASRPPKFTLSGSGTGIRPAYWQAKKNSRNAGDVSATSATPRAAGETEADQAQGQIHGARAQVAIGQDLRQLAAGGEEVASRLALRGVVQPSRQGSEAAEAKGQCRIGGRGGRHRSLFSRNHQSVPRHKTGSTGRARGDGDY